MAWQEVETDVGEKIGRCAYSVHLKHGGARISVPAPIAADMGWTVKTRFRLQVGAGELEGSLRLVADPKGKISGKAPPRKAGALTVRLGRWPSLAPRDVDRVAVEHEMQKDAGALVVRLPTHALMVAPVKAQVEVRKPQVEAPRAQVIPATAPATPVFGRAVGKVDVTSRFFDDPKPKAASRPVSRPPQ